MRGDRRRESRRGRGMGAVLASQARMTDEDDDEDDTTVSYKPVEEKS